MSENDSPVQVYCTFINRCTPTGDGGLYCDKCRTKINDLTDLSPQAIAQLRASNPSACGFVRSVGTMAVATTLALSSYQAAANQTPRPEGVSKVEPPKEKQVVIGGLVCPEPAPEKVKPKPADEANQTPAVPGKMAPPERKPEAYPVAKAVPGKPGVVISPYTGKEVDVRGIKSGSLVMDPAFPVKEQTLFRVP